MAQCQEGCSARYVKLLDEKHVVEGDTLPAPLTGGDAARQFMRRP